jgi:hypothetical protein
MMQTHHKTEQYNVNVVVVEALVNKQEDKL